MQLPAALPVLVYDQPSPFPRSKARNAPTPSATLASPRSALKRDRGAGRVLPALGLIHREMQAIGREAREVGRIAAWIVPAIFRVAGKDLASAAALLLFIAGFAMGLPALMGVQL
jgi:hypothetical protein